MLKISMKGKGFVKSARGTPYHCSGWIDGSEL